jgi:hypothetical protein
MKIILLILLIPFACYGQISGCTDNLAKNFNPNSEINDGSCIYAKTKIKPTTSIILSDTLAETSGLIAFNDLFWTHNDDHDTTIYGIDSIGRIRRKIKLDNVVNIDWEEISQDSSYIYIGDFGNNYRGNRKDLQILRIEKKSFLENKPKIDTISFLYSDQTNLKSQKPNTTNFDCEAFVVSKDSIYLFTKQWKKNKTGIYVIPKIPGKYSAKLNCTLNVKGLITGATITEQNNIVLCGYTKTLKTMVYLLTDVDQFNFSTANLRKIKLALRFHQIEGITQKNQGLFYISNESFIKRPIANKPQSIHTIDLSKFLSEK